jgi:predicted MPP superfamily phosphohydrolase
MLSRIDRRKFLGVAGCCAVGFASVDALVIEPSWLEVIEQDVPIPGLSSGLHGFRIAHISDLHLHRIGRLHEALVAALQKAAPDLVVLTGDSIEASNALGVLADLCRSLTASGREIVATAGNWEHWGNVEMSELDKAYKRCGVRLLGNESTLLASGISVIATDDHCSGYDDVRAALKNVPIGAIRLFLTHAPGIFDELPPDAPTFNFGLAGHTHGGQIRALGVPVWVPPGSGRFRAGMYDTAKGRIYVSRGIGTSVLSARFTCRPELPIFRLVAA